MIENLKKIIDDLPEKEAKTLLYHIFLRMNLVEETQYSQEQFFTDMSKTYKQILNYKVNQMHNKENKPYKKVHIIFGVSASGSLRMVLKESGVSGEEKVITFSDLFSIGPVWQLHTEEGREARKEWFTEHFRYSEGDSTHYMQHFQTALNEIYSIPSDVPVTIWTGENAHEQTGLRFVLYLLREKINTITIINTAEAYKQHFNRQDTRSLYTGEISTERLQTIYDEIDRLIQPLTIQNRDRLVEEWLRLADTREVLRIWKNGCVESVTEEWCDSYIIQAAQKFHNKQKQKNFMKAARVIGEALGSLEQYVGDEFLEYRLRMLISQNVFEAIGSLEAMRYYSVRLQ
ncbi:DUF1835 domain-containing protein [Aneurinibacillus thermoaerophilus]|uniref:DUF1835 domain-containing protein n=2 Tax=Aneurinibacillus TaxID=55079 RepID=A0A1G7XEH3_ANETH|nr:DUF1835 domain-containing protein [Aneurinibacillus thermoaerophilus]AMA74174.1 hypothetical protein ACH33_16015 [Aneurinibacillus sp. XH2]MED0677325.1 DUF1835 domain-containing protein [Aneurinibacillus thermoaerophilus]MED0679082.1 DUF1835 domain-containing protein [Aneurinibacillus thermoaerophilus]MED0757901.1 DUF1835 domain-containing protein [Aneurinibacillus thermoaerophilus]MED0762588.1 DUF1835 domain-containing protein [Aneurinibacillus thermoaerophilus]